MRNALIPIVTLFGSSDFVAIGGGAILTESVFGLQGIGQYVANTWSTRLFAADHGHDAGRRRSSL